MKFAVLASLIASAAAFAPAKQAAKTTSLAAFEDALGVQPPVSVGTCSMGHISPIRQIQRSRLLREFSLFLGP